MKPLAGKRIVVTRPAAQAAAFVRQLEEAGAAVLLVPLIDCKLHESAEDEAVYSKLSTYDWVIFTSKNAVSFFLEKAGSRVKNMPAKWAAVGKKTAEAMKACGLPVDYMPAVFSGEGIAADVQSGAFSPGRALIPKGNLAGSQIGKAIRQSGGTADEWIVYETWFPEQETSRLFDIVRSQQADMYTFFSPSAVQRFTALLQAAGEPLPAADIAVIGTTTAKAAEKLGLSVAVCPHTYTSDALAKDICLFYKE